MNIDKWSGILAAFWLILLSVVGLSALPQFTAFFDNLSVALPVPTTLVLGLSGWLYVALGIIAAVVVIGKDCVVPQGWVGRVNTVLTVLLALILAAICLALYLPMTNV